MKLVGATNWFVRGTGQFMIEGLLAGLIGAVAALILLLLGRTIFLGHVIHLHESGGARVAVPVPRPDRPRCRSLARGDGVGT